VSGGFHGRDPGGRQASLGSSRLLGGGLLGGVDPTGIGLAVGVDHSPVGLLARPAILLEMSGLLAVTANDLFLAIAISSGLLESGQEWQPAILHPQGVDSGKFFVVEAFRMHILVFFFITIGGDGVDLASLSFMVSSSMANLELLCLIGFHNLGTDVVLEAGDEELMLEESLGITDPFCFKPAGNGGVDSGQISHNVIDGIRLSVAESTVDLMNAEVVIRYFLSRLLD